MAVAIQVGSVIARKVALAVTNTDSVSMERYVQLCGNLRTADHFLRDNIFVKDAADMVRFENTVLQSAIKESLNSGGG